MGYGSFLQLPKRTLHFTLITDHKPLEKLEKRHTRNANRLQEAMNTFDFEVVYKKGSEMPADFLTVET
jgi:aspartate aminotransferase-like enzyme